MKTLLCKRNQTPGSTFNPRLALIGFRTTQPQQISKNFAFLTLLAGQCNAIYFIFYMNPYLASYRYSGKRCWRLGYRPRTHPVSCQRKGLRSFLYRGFCLYYHSVNLKHLRAFRGSVLTIMKSICTLLHRKKKLRKVSFNRLGDT